MRTWIAVMVTALSGCAGYYQEVAYVSTLDDVPTANRDRACVRSCLSEHSSCAGRASLAYGDAAQRQGLIACKSNYIACTRTC
jgi:hypothetical protein